MKRLLFTGATGFLGHHCLPLLLKRSYEVHAVSSRDESSNVSGPIWHNSVDLLDTRQIDRLIHEVRPTHLLHLAWIVRPGEYPRSLENFKWVESSIHLLKTFIDCGGQRVVSAGTCAEYGPSDEACSEYGTPLLPSTTYGIAKHAFHTVFEGMTSQLGVSSAWGRIFFVYGPGENQNRFIPTVIRSLIMGRKMECTLGNQVRDFLFIQDVAHVFASLMDTDITGTINIASGKASPLRDVLNHIGDKLKRRDLLALGAIPTPSGETEKVVADISRLKRDLGWNPLFSWDQSWDLTIDWWKSRMLHAVGIEPEA